MYSMKEVCRQTNLTYETLKFYCNEGLIPNVLVLLPYFIGLAGGVFLFAVIVEHFLTKHERLMYRFIIGLVYSSPFVILWDMPWESVEAYQLLIGVSLALLGYEAADLLGGEG